MGGLTNKQNRKLREACRAAEAVCLQAMQDCPQWAKYLSETARQCTEALLAVPPQERG